MPQANSLRMTNLQGRRNRGARGQGGQGGLEKDKGVIAYSHILVGIKTKLSWVMTLVWHPFVLIFSICSAALHCSVCHLWSENGLRRQSVTEPKPMSLPINYPA